MCNRDTLSHQLMHVSFSQRKRKESTSSASTGFTKASLGSGLAGALGSVGRKSSLVDTSTRIASGQWCVTSGHHLRRTFSNEPGELQEYVIMNRSVIG